MCCTGASSAQYYFQNIADGTLSISSGVLTTSSDERLKNVDGDFNRGLEEILALDPIQYTWKNSEMNTEGSIYAGFSAQNVQEVIPEAVSSGNNGYLGLSDRPILAASVNAIKELYERLENNNELNDGIVERLEIDLDDIREVTEENTSLLTSISQTIEDFVEQMESMGATVIDGVLNLTDVIVQKLTTSEIVIHNEEHPEQTGLVIYDRVTGEPICVFFEDGEMKTVEGECDVVESNNVNDSDSEDNDDLMPVDDSTSGSSGGGGSDDVSTSTDDVIDDTATSTENDIDEEDTSTTTEEVVEDIPDDPGVEEPSEPEPEIIAEPEESEIIEEPSEPEPTPEPEPVAVE